MHVEKKYLSDIVLEFVNLKIQSFLAINSYRILFSRGLVIHRSVPTLSTRKSRLEFIYQFDVNKGTKEVFGNFFFKATKSENSI